MFYYHIWPLSWQFSSLSLKVLITIAVFLFVFIVFQRKLDIFLLQRIYMKHHALFSSKDESKKISDICCNFAWPFET